MDLEDVIALTHVMQNLAKMAENVKRMEWALIPATVRIPISEERIVPKVKIIVCNPFSHHLLLLITSLVEFLYGIVLLDPCMPDPCTNGDVCYHKT